MRCFTCVRMIFFMMCCALLLCCCYHVGVPGIRKNLVVGAVSNMTEEPELDGLVSGMLRECIASKPWLTEKDGPEYSLDVNVVSIRSISQARAEMRDKKTRNKDEDAYQTVLHRIDVKLTYEVYGEAADAPVYKGKVTGTASLPLMHDRQVALKNAMKQAVRDAVGKIILELEDAG